MIQIDIDNKLLDNHLAAILDIDLYKDKTIEDCPYCHKNNYIKHGSYQKKQRFLCKCCGKTFSSRTNTTFYRTKKSPVLWSKFINFMLSKKSLRYSAHELRISLSTAFYWRHKLLYSLTRFTETTELIDKVDMIKIFTKENYKGNRNAPRNKREKVWTILAHDTNESILASPISIGKWDKKSFDKIIYSKVNVESYLTTYCDRYLHRIAENHNKDNKKVKGIIHDTSLWRCVKEVRDSLRKFKGVATKYLTHYLYFSSVISVGEKYNPILLLYRLIGMDTYIMSDKLKLIKIIP